MFTWDVVPPIDQNGVITMYEVLYEPLETFNGAIMSNTTTVDGMTLTAVLEGLEEYVNYNMSVRAYTSAGEGPYSDGVIVLTLEDGKGLQFTGADLIGAIFSRINIGAMVDHTYFYCTHTNCYGMLELMVCKVRIVCSGF